MKTRTRPIIAILMLLLSACGNKKTDVPRPAEKPPGVKGGWTLGTKNYLFELRPGYTGGIQGTVKVIEGLSCKKASLRVSSYQPGWLKADWDESKFANCPSESAEFVEIPRDFAERVAVVTSDFSKVQLPTHLMVHDLPAEQLDLAPLVFGTGSVLLTGSKPAALRPVIKVGAVELKGIAIHETVLRDPWSFEKLEIPVAVRPLQLDAEDAVYEAKSGKAFCLNRMMIYANEEEVAQKKREKFWTAAEHRSILFPMLRNVLNNELQSYQANAEEASCTK